MLDYTPATGTFSAGKVSAVARMTVVVDDETKERLIELAGGERKIGEKINELVAEEYTRQTVTIERLAERVAELERLVAAMVAER